MRSVLLSLARRPRLYVMGTARSSLLLGLLAVLAVLGMGLASGWHSATFHDDDPVHMAAGDRHAAPEQNDPDAPIHVAAHAIGHWMLTPPEAQIAPAAVSVAQRHLLPLVRHLAGIGAPGLLRPPQG